MSRQVPVPICETAISQSRYPIRPDDVPLNGESSDLSTFGTAEVEEIAGHLLMFFKSRGYWCAFTIDELGRYYKEHGWDPNTMFYGLLGAYVHFGGGGAEIYMHCDPMLIADSSGTYYVTDFFIECCCRRLKKVT